SRSTANGPRSFSGSPTRWPTSSAGASSGRRRTSIDAPSAAPVSRPGGAGGRRWPSGSSESASQRGSCAGSGVRGGELAVMERRCGGCRRGQDEQVLLDAGSVERDPPARLVLGRGGAGCSAGGWHARDPMPDTLTARELSERCGEPVENLLAWRSLGLIGREGVEAFAPDDAERARLVRRVLPRGGGPPAARAPRAPRRARR